MRAEIERRIELVKAGLLEMKQSRAKSDNLQTLCDGDCGRLACLERICFSNHMASAKDFLWFLDIACNEAAAPARREGWCGLFAKGGAANATACGPKPKHAWWCKSATEYQCSNDGLRLFCLIVFKWDDGDPCEVRIVAYH